MPQPGRLRGCRTTEQPSRGGRVGALGASVSSYGAGLGPERVVQVQDSREDGGSRSGRRGWGQGSAAGWMVLGPALSPGALEPLLGGGGQGEAAQG